MLKRISTIVGNYAACRDPLADVACKVALVVAFNQPLYPLYLHAILGVGAWPAWLTLFSTPFFVSIPAIARRSSLVGRIILPAVGVTNTTACVKLFGISSGVELFLIPCALLGAVLFRPTERLSTLPILGLPFATYFLVNSWLGSPIMPTPPGQLWSVIAVNAMSVGTLTALVGLLVVARFAALESER